MAAMVDDYGGSAGVVEMDVDGDFQQPVGKSGGQEKKRKEDEKRLFRIHKTILKMLRNRGYTIPDRQIGMTYADFVLAYGDDEYDDSGVATGAKRSGSLRNRLTTWANKEDDEQMRINVEFSEESKVGVEPIRRISKFMEDQGFERSILVVQSGGLTPFAKQALQVIGSQFKIEYFKESELLVDITEHELVPEHVVLSENQKQELLKRYKLKDSQLPRLQETDPVARYFGLTRGQVVKIIRPSETAGRYVTYRIVW
jgi:DNA-directed RNA polymerases I, II, and III subunit RPABC1|eukprot:Stramenopile-MAST_4_protein_2642